LKFIMTVQCHTPLTNSFFDRMESCARLEHAVLLASSHGQWT
jgi:hypothetical protein